MVGRRVPGYPAQVGAGAPGTAAVEQFAAEHLKRHAGDAVAGELAAAEAEIAQGPGQTIGELAGRCRQAQPRQGAAEAELDALVAGAAGVVVGAHLDPQAVAGGNQLIVDLAAVQRQAPGAGADAALAADLDGAGALHIELHQFGASHGRIGRRYRAADDFPEGRRLVAAADVGVPALLRGGRPVHPELGGEVVPVLIQSGTRIGRARIAAHVAPLGLGDQGPVARQVPVEPGEQVEILRNQVEIAVTLQAPAILRAVGVQLAGHVAVRPAEAQAVVQRLPVAVELPLCAQGIAAGQGVAERVGEVVVGVLGIDAESLAQVLVAPLRAVGDAQLLGVAVRVAPVDVEQPVLRRVAVAQDAARIVLHACLGNDVGNLEGQVAPGQVAAVLDAIGQAQAEVTLHDAAMRGRVVAVAIVLILADANPPIQVALLHAGRGLQAITAEAAGVQAQAGAFVGAGQRLQVQLAAQGGGAGAARVGAAAGTDQGAVARLQQADDEGAVGLVERQAVLQQQHAAVDRVALDARAADVQARLVGGAEEVLDDDARLVVQRIAQGGQAGFPLRLDQVGGARHPRQTPLLLFERGAERRRLALATDGQGIQHRDIGGQGKARQRHGQGQAERGSGQSGMGHEGLQVMAKGRRITSSGRTCPWPAGRCRPCG
ncbi:hypothetical protein D3C84_277440 [compost metagenome]